MMLCVLYCSWSYQQCGTGGDKAEKSRSTIIHIARKQVISDPDQLQHKN